MIVWEYAALAVAVTAAVFSSILFLWILREQRRWRALNDLLLFVCVTAYHARQAPILQAWADVMGAEIRTDIQIQRPAAREFTVDQIPKIPGKSKP